MSKPASVSVILFMILLLSLCLHLAACFADPFLNFWDECFHAVVAKNMVQTPLVPKLYLVEALPLTDHWPKAGVWLHKPPFFLWQMALSIGIFGPEPWAVRLPSALWMTVLTWVMYRMGKLLVSERVGLIAAFFMAVAYYPLELVTGGLATDHNDATFIAVVCCSWWAWLELVEHKDQKMAVLTGFFIACAVLTKWYVGAVILLPWILLLTRPGTRSKTWGHLFLAVLTAAIIVVPWVIYSAALDPTNAAVESQARWLHLIQPVEGHRADWMFHFSTIEELIPPHNMWVILLATGWLVWKCKKMEHRIWLVSTVMSVHLLFAIAQTKMMGYTMLLIPIYFLAIAIALNDMLSMVRSRMLKDTLTTAAALVLGYFMMDGERLWLRHSVNEDHVLWEQDGRKQMLATVPVMAELAAMIPPPDSAVVFNIPRVHHIEFMFRYGHQAMDLIPDQEQVDRLRDAGYQVIVVQDGYPLDEFPDQIRLIQDEELSFPRIKRE